MKNLYNVMNIKRYHHRSLLCKNTMIFTRFNPSLKKFFSFHFLNSSLLYVRPLADLPISENASLEIAFIQWCGN